MSNRPCGCDPSDSAWLDAHESSQKTAREEVRELALARVGQDADSGAIEAALLLVDAISDD